MFVAPESFPVLSDLIEADAIRKRQSEFRRRVRTERIVDDAFSSPEKLASAVTAALHNWGKEQGETTRIEQPPGRLPAEMEPAAEPTVGPNPYRGLEAFRKEDAGRFFGREALVEKLWQAFIALHGSAADGEAPVRLLDDPRPFGLRQVLGRPGRAARRTGRAPAAGPAGGALGGVHPRGAGRSNRSP